jgi:DNA-binding NtrC family response regulator
VERRRVVLVVDDEHSVLECLVSAVESADLYDVVSANSFQCAAAHLASSGSIDILVSDFRLRGARSGLELCEIAVALNSTIAIVLISAESSTEVEPRPRRIVFVRKPLDRGELLQAIEAAVSKVAEQ